ncbi:MarR family winged helix-turn-helix transcriptional regulator [Rhodococcoides kyotonense]|uniref:DNA-binding transcriptional regulator, MarR family n=1 Tax=Rhodococcoides kyotonense TaxID=398843 RepID=A0A239E7U6_9NOCA|nr:MarR family transcriptional regulator [Rhodococcus kyotonensis]SNS40726.1 DNA-binding transcriptional regulator, MarR family [Rhodococcus kyotonensis]
MSNSNDDLARGVLDAAFDLRRVLRAHLPESGTDETLPLAQAEVVRTVLAFPDSRIGDIATRLKLRHNTVSTLVRTLVDKGLLDRHPDPTDGRAVVLRVNEERTARRERRTDRRIEVLSAEIGQLTPAERRAVEKALPAMVKLNEGLRLVSENV